MSILDKLAKIEALIEKASTEGERTAALAAKERIICKNQIQAVYAQPVIEYKISLHSTWEKYLFNSLCRKHGLESYRYFRQKYTTTNVKTTKAFMDKILWPEYLKFSEILRDLIEDITKDVIKKIWKEEEKETVLSQEISFHSDQ